MRELEERIIAHHVGRKRFRCGTELSDAIFPADI